MKAGIDYQVKLIDRLRAGQPILPPAWIRASTKERERSDEWARKAAAEAEVFLIDNVAEYFYAGTPQEEWDPRTDFPCLSPPFPCFWMEYQHPGRVWSEVHGHLDCSDSLGTRFGFLFAAEDFAELHRGGKLGVTNDVGFLVERIRRGWEVWGRGLEQKVPAHFLRSDYTGVLPADLKRAYGLNDAEMVLLSDLVALACVRNEVNPFENLRESDIGILIPRWVLRAVGFLWRDDMGLMGPIGEWSLGLCGDGSVRKDGYFYGLPLYPSDPTPDPAGWDFIAPCAFPAFMAITFLHCKNVSQRQVVPPPTLSARWMKKTKRPLVDYRLLHIEPMCQVIKGAGADGHNCATFKPLHVCRGHFKDYRERGLFGRHKGIYWWDNYVRGDVSRGIHFKDYSVN